MGILKFSNDMLSGSTASLQGQVVNFGNRSFALNDNFGAAYGFFSCGSNSSYTYSNIGAISIMSGTIPTNVESLTISTPPAGTQRLWRAYAIRPYNTSDIPNYLPTQDNWYTNPTIINSIFIEATETGFASWFWIYTGQQGRDYPFYTPPEPTAICHNIIGTIGTVGSGADMEMLNTSVVAGQFLRVINLNLQMPAAFS